MDLGGARAGVGWSSDRVRGSLKGGPLEGPVLSDGVGYVGWLWGAFASSAAVPSNHGACLAFASNIYHCLQPRLISAQQHCAFVLALPTAARRLEFERSPRSQRRTVSINNNA